MSKNHNAIRVLAGDGLSAFGAWIDFIAILTLAAAAPVRSLGWLAVLRRATWARLKLV